MLNDDTSDISVDFLLALRYTHVLSFTESGLKRAKNRAVCNDE